MQEKAGTQESKEPLSSWDLFVLRHQKKSNLWGHFISFLMFYGGLIGAAVTQNGWWLIPFFLSGAMGALSHFLSGDSKVDMKEATSSPRVVFYVTIMFYKIAMGRYSEDIEAANGRYAKLNEVSPDEPTT